MKASAGLAGAAGPKGPVVLAIVDRLGIQGLSSLERTSAALGSAPRCSLDALAEDAAYHAIGTGAARVEVLEALHEALVSGAAFVSTALEPILTLAEQQRGTFVDFMTERERERCRVHVIVTLGDAAGPHRFAVLALLDELVRRELPFVVHAILDGPDRTAEEALGEIEARLGSTGKLASLIGGDHAVGPTLDWDRAVDTYRCIVRDHDGPVAARPFDAFADARAAGIKDVEMKPTRIGEYDGLTGSLQADFATSAPVWAWHGFDVGVLLTSRGHELDRLASVLLNVGVPDAVASRIVVNGRPVHAFSADSLATSMRIARLPLRPLVETRAAGGATLVRHLVAAGRRCVKVFEPSRRVLATFTLEGDEPEPLDERACGLLEMPSGAEACARAERIVAEGRADFVHLAVAVGHAAELDEPIAKVAEATAGRQGTMFLIASDVAVVASPTIAAAPRTHAEVFAAALASSDVTPSVSLPARAKAAPSRRAKETAKTATPKKRAAAKKVTAKKATAKKATAKPSKKSTPKRSVARAKNPASSPASRASKLPKRPAGGAKRTKAR